MVCKFYMSEHKDYVMLCYVMYYLSESDQLFVLVLVLLLGDHLHVQVGLGHSQLLHDPLQVLEVHY